MKHNPKYMVFCDKNEKYIKQKEYYTFVAARNKYKKYVDSNVYEGVYLLEILPEDFRAIFSWERKNLC